MTLWSAYQHFEEKTKGSIETGKLADFVILDKDPTAIDAETIDQIKVVQTIKEDVTVFDLADMKKAGASLQPGDPSELAFTRAMLAAAEAHDHDHGHDHSHAHGGGCLCGFMARLGEVIATENP
jgi:Amidohydrolase family